MTRAERKFRAKQRFDAAYKGILEVFAAQLHSGATVEQGAHTVDLWIAQQVRTHPDLKHVYAAAVAEFSKQFAQRIAAEEEGAANRAYAEGQERGRHHVTQPATPEPYPPYEIGTRRANAWLIGFRSVTSPT